MKKLAVLFVMILLALSSCSGDDSPVTEPETPLTTNGTVLRRVIETVDSNVYTKNYFYEGNKIQKIVAANSNANRSEYVYTGNLITQFLYYQNNILNFKEEYRYNSQEKMDQFIVYTYSTNTAYRVDFTYNIDGTVSLLGYTGNFSTQSTQVLDKKVFLFTNGDVEKIEEYVVVNGNNHIRTSYYTYDNKNYTANSVLGLNKIRSWYYGSSGNSHNIVSELKTTTENSSTNTYQSVYTYNSFDFPVTVTQDGLTVQYFYQQP